MEKAIAIDKNYLLLENGKLLKVKEDLEFGKIYTFDLSSVDLENLVEMGEIDNKKIDFSTARKIYGEFKNAHLVDVRGIIEFYMNGIGHAVNVPLGKIDSISDKDIDKDDIVMVYCRSGMRSKEAQEALIKLGFKHVLDVGGLIDYKGEFDDLGEK